ncbi:MAG: sigma-54-dependent transcriptional regulator [Thermodesulfobacteriota bacterium]
MNDLPPQILVVDDEPIARANLAHIFSRRGAQVTVAADGREALAELEKNEFDLVVTDLIMEDVDGLAVLKRTKALWPDTEVVVVTGYPTVETAVAAMQQGAYHYLAKPYGIEEARILAKKALEKRRLRLEVRSLRERLRENPDPLTIVGHCPAMERLKRTVAQVAPTDSTVLILGETGTGKELVARSIHLLSSRREERFLAVNCGAFNEELLENELFGHEPGAFTGATRLKKGLFESAPGGTLFLDELGETSPAMQVKLLRVLQERVIRRVGGSRDIPVDVRIVAATNKDLKREVEAGRFRQDLFYRINVVVLTLPPLSERQDDIPLLCRFFLAKMAKKLDKPTLTMSPEVLGILTRYPFPGNVRELENIIERAAIMADGESIEPRHLPPDLSGAPVRVARPCVNEPVTLEENERRHVAWVLGHCGGNRSKAATVLGIDRASLWRKIKKYGLA